MENKPELTGEVEEWLKTLGPERANRVTALMDHVAERGPTLGRPLVDRVKGSRHHKMKELRDGTIRVLFVFHDGQPLMLVAGDKRGAGNGWYPKRLTQADRLYDQHRSDNGRGGSSRHRDPPDRGR